MFLESKFFDENMVGLIILLMGKKIAVNQFGSAIFFLERCSVCMLHFLALNVLCFGLRRKNFIFTVVYFNPAQSSTRYGAVSF